MSTPNIITISKRLYYPFLDLVGLPRRKRVISKPGETDRLVSIPNSDVERYTFLPDTYVHRLGHGDVEVLAKRESTTDELQLRLHLPKGVHLRLTTTDIARGRNGQVSIHVEDTSAKRRQGHFEPTSLARVLSLIIKRGREGIICQANQFPSSVTKAPPTVNGAQRSYLG